MATLPRWIAMRHDSARTEPAGQTSTDIRLQQGSSLFAPTHSFQRSRLTEHHRYIDYAAMNDVQKARQQIQIAIPAKQRALPPPNGQAALAHISKRKGLNGNACLITRNSAQER